MSASHANTESATFANTASAMKQANATACTWKPMKAGRATCARWLIGPVTTSAERPTGHPGMASRRAGIQIPSLRPTHASRPVPGPSRSERPRAGTSQVGDDLVDVQLEVLGEPLRVRRLHPEAAVR